MNNTNPTPVTNNVKVTITFDELYQMQRLYETILDLDLELHPLCDDVFIKILEVN